MLGKDEVTSSNLVISSTYNPNVFKALGLFFCSKAKCKKLHKSA